MKHLKIALVEATTDSTHVYSRAYLPRVGIPTMGAILNNMGYSCDLWIKPMSDQEKEQLLQYDIVGIGSLSNTITNAYQLADYLKQNNTTVIMGGPHVTFMPEEALEHCDYVVIGEGDVTLPDLITALEKDRSPEAIPGLVYRLSSNDIHYTEKASVVDYANLPSPDFTLSPQVDPAHIPPIVITSRGCPHNCSFCSVTSVFGRRYRFKRNEQIIDELRPILHRSVCFGDDNFCANSKRTKSLLRDMIAQKAVPLRWSGQMCVKDASDNELLGLMQETRCRIMYVGIESVNADTLKKFGKAHQTDAIKECVDNLHRHNIGIHGMFVVDSKDNVETAREIVDYAIEADIDTIQICPLTPLPGTVVYEENKNNLLHTKWNLFDAMHVVVKQQKCSAADMQLAIVHEVQRFYSLKRVIMGYRPGRGWRVKYRAGGNYLSRRWLKENAEYIEYLRTIAR
jgi:radical SAM superfamily enzyme YgiQ (UPF0313 family)